MTIPPIATLSIIATKRGKEYPKEDQNYARTCSW